MGGSDRPAEVLLTFLFRYGGRIRGHHKMDLVARTRMSQSMVIECCHDTNGGSSSLVDMGGVYQMDNCVQLFEECWNRIYESLCWNHQRTAERQQSPKNKDKCRTSYLMQIIDVKKLENERFDCIQKAATWVQHSHLKGGRTESRHQVNALSSSSSAKRAPFHRQQTSPRSRKKQRRTYSV